MFQHGAQPRVATVRRCGHCRGPRLVLCHFPCRCRARMPQPPKVMDLWIPRMECHRISPFPGSRAPTRRNSNASLGLCRISMGHRVGRIRHLRPPRQHPLSSIRIRRIRRILSSTRCHPHPDNQTHPPTPLILSHLHSHLHLPCHSMVDASDPSLIYTRIYTCHVTVWSYRAGLRWASSLWLALTRGG